MVQVLHAFYDPLPRAIARFGAFGHAVATELANLIGAGTAPPHPGTPFPLPVAGSLSLCPRAQRPQTLPPVRPANETLGALAIGTLHIEEVD